MGEWRYSSIFLDVGIAGGEWSAPGTSSDRRLDGSQSRYGLCREEKNLALPGIEPGSLREPQFIRRCIQFPRCCVVCAGIVVFGLACEASDTCCYVSALSQRSCEATPLHTFGRTSDSERKDDHDCWYRREVAGQRTVSLQPGVSVLSQHLLTRIMLG
jgi:hypothetical protein